MAAEKLTPEVHAKIVQGVRDGLTHETAANAAGVSRRTLVRWLAKGDKALRGPYAALARDIAVARALAIEEHVSIVRQAGRARPVKKTVTKVFVTAKGQEVRETTVTETREDGDWRASAFWLERMDRQVFGKSWVNADEPKAPTGEPSQTARDIMAALEAMDENTDGAAS